MGPASCRGWKWKTAQKGTTSSRSSNGKIPGQAGDDDGLILYSFRDRILKHEIESCRG